MRKPAGIFGQIPHGMLMAGQPPIRPVHRVEWSLPVGFADRKQTTFRPLRPECIR
jgi:hypothetical protein